MSGRGPGMTWRPRRTGSVMRSTGSGHSAPPTDLAMHRCYPWDCDARPFAKGHGPAVTEGHGSIGRAMERVMERLR
jgi:hypothetical protein